MENEREYKKENKRVIRVPVWMASAVLAITVAILFVALYLQFTRYKLVARAIDKGDSTTSALLLSPEIASGLARII